MKRSLIVLFALMYPAVALSQATNSADITGTVTDQTGAIIPGVTVTVLDNDKNVTHAYVTNNSGAYDTGPIVPDHYTVTFGKEGFSTIVRGPVALDIGMTGLNAEMTVGQTSQRIVVSTNAPLLETTTAELSTTLNTQTLVDLPQVGTSPDWQEFIILQPGVSSTSQNGGSVINPGMGGAAANGSLPFSTALLDGASTSSPQSNNVIMTPIFDAVSEVKMSDSLFSAQYGVGGMLYNQISKGGSNQFHGMGYEYFQNSALNAAPYSFGTHAPVPVLRYNDFGGNIGGPILKNRMFFFFDYDQRIDHGGASNGFITVPDAAMRQGDFTGQNPVYDPTTQTVDAAGVVHRQTFASEYGNGNKIPGPMIDSVAQAIQNYYPAPNLAGTIVNGIPTNNYFYNVPTSSPIRKYFGRLDMDVTAANRITASTAWNKTTPTSLGDGFCPINCLSISVFNSNNQVSDVWTISPHAINEARIGFMEELDELVPVSVNAGIPAKIGLQFAKANIFPTINIGSTQSSTGTSTNEYGLAPGTNAVYKENIFDISDVVTLIRGRHVLHLGGEILVERVDSTQWGNINAATLTYSGVYTASTQGSANTTGSPYADFLLGYTQNWTASVAPEYGGRLKNPQFFVQDDIKLRPNLTVNLGLRWMGETGWSDVKGNELSFDPTIVNPATNTPGAMWYATTHLNGRTTLQKGQWNTWMPRVGIAYQPHPNTTIRGGFGIYSFPWNTDTYGVGLGAALSSSGNVSDTTNGVNPVVLLNSDGNTNYQGPGGSSINAKYQMGPQNPASYNGQGVTYEQYNSPVPKVEQWNFSLQRQLSGDTVAQIAYVGSHGYNLAFLTDENQVPEGKLAPDDASGSTNARPYPQFQGITSGVNAVAISNYNSLQAVITRRMATGLEFSFNYTWSKFMDDQDSSGWGSKQGFQPFQNAYVPSANYGPSNFDIRNAFKGQMIYQLPFGRDRRFLNDNSLLSYVVGDWQASTSMVIQGGNPFTPTMANNTSYSQAGELYPNVVANPILAGKSVHEWFNVNAYAAPVPAAFGDMRRNSVYGPGLATVNFAINKTFPITERVTMEIFADATNLFNHPAFGQPDSTIGPGHMGQITTVTVGGRAMQLVGKIRF